MPKIGLALGGGGARGLAHIGILKILKTNHLPIDLIAGSSIGALIGGFYAAHQDVGKIEKIFSSSSWRQILDLILDPSLAGGLIAGKKIENFIQSQLGLRKFKDLKTPFAAVATDLQTGQAIVVKEGNLAPAIRASISVPLIFQPVKKNGYLLADGGLSMPVPVKVVKNMGADLTLAVNLDAHYFTEQIDEKKWPLVLAERSLNILRHHLAERNVESADLVLRPKTGISGLGLVGWKKFLNGKKIIESGEEEMKLALPKLRELINQKIENISPRLTGPGLGK